MKTVGTIAVVLISSLLATACTSPFAVAPRPCDIYLPQGEVEGKTILCGYVAVPWDHSGATSATAQLAVVILKATGDHPQPDAIVHISGGPGAGATLRDVVPEMILRYAPLRAEHDIILYDQRGMGRSQPFFTCPYPEDGDRAALTPQLEQQLGRTPSAGELQAAYCARDWAARGLPVSEISTQASAADLVDLMTALGYPAYNLYGISYGTRLAMAMMHFNPDNSQVRSIVLDSPYPLPEDKVNDYNARTPLGRQALFEAVFQVCADDPLCASAYPDLRARFDVLVARLNTSPLKLEDGQTFSGDDLVRTVFPLNEAINFIAYQPRLIAELERGDITTLMLLRSGQVPSQTMVTGTGPDVEGFPALLDAYMACSAQQAATDDQEPALVRMWDAEVKTIQGYITGLCPGDKAVAVNALLDSLPARAFNGIIARFAPERVQGVNSMLNTKLSCTEQYPFREDPQAVATELYAAGLPEFLVDDALARIAALADGCAGWRDALSAPTPASFGDYPVLILGGQFDSITPPGFAQSAAQVLPGAQLVDIPNAAHSILGNKGDCPTNIVKQFLAAPRRPVDASCTATMHVKFVMPGAALPLQ